jgi:hypothetical protein
MALTGELVPLVLIPRFTTYVGTGDYTSVGIDVSGFASGVMIASRGPLLGTTPSCDVYIEESEDQDPNNWHVLDSVDLAAVSPETLEFTITRRWLRVRVSLSSSDAAVTCWCSGSLERRVA